MWAALRNNPVLAARHAHLTGRADNKLTSTQARVAVAGSLLRQLHAVLTTGTPWDPAIASGGLDATQRRGPPLPHDPRRRRRPDGASPHVRRDHIPRKTMGSPARLHQSPDEGCRETTRLHAT